MNMLEYKRKRLGYTRLEMGRLMRCTEDTIYNWETNRRFPKSTDLINIQNHYQLTNQELLLYLREIYEFNNNN